MLSIFNEIHCVCVRNALCHRSCCTSNRCTVLRNLRYTASSQTTGHNMTLHTDYESLFWRTFESLC